MLNLEQAIPNLLYRYSSIYIPGIGTFNKINKPSAIQKSGKELLLCPRHEKINFVEEVQNEDFIYTHFVSELNIPFAEVENEVKKTVESWKTELNKGNDVVLGNLGKLVKSLKGDILFFQDSDFLYQPSEPMKISTYKSKLKIVLSLFMFLFLIVFFVIVGFLAYYFWETYADTIIEMIELYQQ